MPKNCYLEPGFSYLRNSAYLR